MSLSKYHPALAPFIKTALSPHVCPILLLKINFLLKDFQTYESSWYLNSISINPKYQCQGIATNLIKMVEEKVWCSVRYNICQTSSHLQATTTSILALCATDNNVRDCRDRYKFAHHTAGCSIQSAPFSIQRRSTSTNSGRWIHTCTLFYQAWSKVVGINCGKQVVHQETDLKTIDLYKALLDLNYAHLQPHPHGYYHKSPEPIPAYQ